MQENSISLTKRPGTSLDEQFTVPFRKALREDEEHIVQSADTLAEKPLIRWQQ